MSLRSEDLMVLVARYYKLSPEVLRGKSRKKNIVLARHVAMFLLRQVMGLSLSEVGQVLGFRDHSTVDHACKKVERLAKMVPALRTEIDNLRLRVVSSQS